MKSFDWLFAREIQLDSVSLCSIALNALLIWKFGLVLEMVAKNLSCTQTVKIQSSSDCYDPALLSLMTLSTKSIPYQSQSLSLSYGCLCLRMPSMVQVVFCCLIG